TPEITFARLKGSLTPDLFSTDSEAVSTVEKRREQCGHCRRRRIAAPSSDVRESTTRESGWRQDGQCVRQGYRPVAWARPPSSRHGRRRRIAAPSSDVSESTTRESGWRQNGQCIRQEYRQVASERPLSSRLGQLDLLTGGHAPGGQVVQTPDLGDVVPLAHAVGG